MKNSKGSQLLAGNKQPKNIFTLIDNNHLFLETQDDFIDTIVQIPVELRHKGLWITFADHINNETLTLIYNSNNIEDGSFSNINNWINVAERDDLNTTMDIKVSAKDSNKAGVNVSKISKNKFKIDFDLPAGPQGPTGKRGEQGPAGKDGKDGTDGTDGKDGITEIIGQTFRHLYSIGSQTEAPSVIRDNINPGDNWTSYIPTILDKDTQCVWMISAEVTTKNELVNTWSEPVIYVMYGKDGEQGPAGPEGPQGPAGNDGTDGTDGSTVIVGDNGNIWIDGVDTGIGPSPEDPGTGITPEIPNYKSYVYKKADVKPDNIDITATNTVEALKSLGWEDYPTDSNGQWWQCILTINGTTNLIEVASAILPVNGKDGTSGGEGGIDGKSVRMLFAWVNDRDYNWNTWYDTYKNNPNPNETGQPNFSINPGACPGNTKDYDYYMIQASFNSNGTMASSWSYPVNIKGEHGANGAAGMAGPIMYPAGEFDLNTAYIRDNDTCPYVYYNGEHYYLKTLGPWVATEHGNITPNQSLDWVKFSQFEAIYSKIALIGNGQVGNAVFNGNWMFSKKGKNASNEIVNNFEDFNPDDPFNPNNAFRPSFALNFVTGDIFYNCGKSRLTEDGIESTGGYFSQTNTPGYVGFESTSTSKMSLKDDNIIFIKYTDTDITIPGVGDKPSTTIPQHTEIHYIFGIDGLKIYNVTTDKIIAEISYSDITFNIIKSYNIISSKGNIDDINSETIESSVFIQKRHIYATGVYDLPSDTLTGYYEISIMVTHSGNLNINCSTLGTVHLYKNKEDITINDTNFNITTPFYGKLCINKMITSSDILLVKY